MNHIESLFEAVRYLHYCVAGLVSRSDQDLLCILLLSIDDKRLASSMELFPRAFRLFDLQELFLAQVR